MQGLSEPSLWAIVVALAGVVGWGGKWMAKKLDKCEEKHDEANKAIVDLAVKVGEARGFDECTRSIEQKFEQFHREMIDEVRGDTPGG